MDALIGKSVIMTNPETRTIVTSAGDIIRINDYYNRGLVISRAYVSAMNVLANGGEIRGIQFLPSTAEKTIRLSAKTAKNEFLILAAVSLNRLTDSPSQVEWLNGVTVTWGLDILEGAESDLRASFHDAQ